MKTYHIILGALLATSIASCDGNDIIPEIPDTPGQPTDSVVTEGYQFTFGGSTDTDEEATRASWTDVTENGKKLVFGWDYTDEKNPTYDMKMAFVKGSQVLKSTKRQSYTDVTILKHSTKDDRHWAEFKTVERYQYELKEYDGHTLIAVNGKKSNLTKIGDKYAFQLTMPNTFTQSAANSLAHLSDYMYMYDTYVLQGGDAHLEFKHLTAPVRFRIHNWRPSEVKIYSASMLLSDNTAITGSSVSVDKDTEKDKPSYTSGHSEITVKAADDSYFTIAERSENKYIDLYAHVLPLGNADGIKGKTIQFTIEANDIVTGEKKVHYLTSKADHISADIFNGKTGSYNWKAGYLYTFHIYLDDAIYGVTVENVSIKDWVNVDLGTSETE